MDDLQQPWQRCQEQFLTQIFRRSNSVESLRKYRQVLKQFFTIYPKPPDHITRSDIEEFMERPSESLRNRGATVTNATRNLRLTVLSSFYSYAATYTISSPDGPVPLLQRPAPTIGVKRGRRTRSYRALSYDELSRLFATIPRDTVLGARDRALFSAYWWTARRRQEILRLKWGDLEQTTIVENGTQRVMWIYRFYGKGTSTQQDTAEMPTPAMGAILHYLECSGRLATMTAEDYVFTSTRNLPWRKGKPMGSDVVAKTLKKYVILAGLDEKKISVHSLRHSAARIRYENGSDIREVQHLLRHRSIATTDLYLRQLVTVADEGAKRLEERFGSL